MEREVGKESIKLVAFDLTDVLFKWEDALTKLSKITGTSRKEVHKFIIENLQPIEKGKTLPKDFWDSFRVHFDINTSSNELINIWSSSFQKIDENWVLARRMKDKGYKLAICSNSWSGLIELIQNQHSGFEIFDFIFDSSKIGYIKPQPEYFKFVEDKTGFKGKEILLIDDSENNLKGAKDYGWEIQKYN